MKIKTAIISVSDKTGVVEFARGLQALGIKIISTGKTASLLKENRINAIPASEYTGSPEILDGRVKTLHPKIEGGILADRKNKKHIEELKKNKIEPIGLVVVNLYPFDKIISNKDAGLKEVVENIDIGGPTMIRAAAKNYENVAVVVEPADYGMILEELKKGEFTEELLKKLALKAFQLTGRYDAIISGYFSAKFEPGNFPSTMNLTFRKIKDLRHGENPHQRAALYVEPFIDACSIVNSRQLHGKELSYNNLIDMNDSFDLIREFNEPSAAIIKHTNPCGVASRKTIEDAFRDAYNVDPMAAYGCVIALNRPCNKKTAELMKGKFIEVVICPNFEKDALEILKEKKNIRLMETDGISKLCTGYFYKKISGGLLVQTSEFPELKENMMKVVTKRKPTKKEIEDLIFAFKVNKHVKSNAIIIAKGKTAYGIGAGQMSRVDSSIIAVRKSNGRGKGGVLSSDAFFPFRDGIDEAAKAGIKAIIQPGGSIRDNEVIQAADEHGIAMVFTGIRLFKH